MLTKPEDKDKALNDFFKSVIEEPEGIPFFPYHGAEPNAYLYNIPITEGVVLNFMHKLNPYKLWFLME